MLAVVLKIVGPPLFILPAIAAQSLMPELAVPPNSPQYTYAALSLQFLPVGLMGLMIAAMFSATMSTLSGDYNVMASVITEDIYRRLFDKDASQKRWYRRPYRDFGGWHTHHRHWHQPHRVCPEGVVRGDGDRLRFVRRSDADTDARRTSKPPSHMAWCSRRHRRRIRFGPLFLSLQNIRLVGPAGY
jgi:hypothetical protein